MLAVVATGARARALEQVLARIGYKPTQSRPGPRIIELSVQQREQLSLLYLALGGKRASPQFRPGAWDLAFSGGLVVELDEELHFNRYRNATLQQEWTADLPWRIDYLLFTERHETECLTAGRWGKRWTSTSSEALFGSPDPAGKFTSGGAPRWKQRALYDAIKDAAALDVSDLRVARLATVDIVGGVRLGAGLEGRYAVDLEALQELLLKRSTC